MLNCKGYFLTSENFSDLKKWIGCNDSSLWPKYISEQFYCYNFV